MAIGGAALLLFATTACSGTTESTDAPQASEVPTELGLVSNLSDVMDAIDAAGIDCGDWEQLKAAADFEESAAGACPGGGRVAMFETESDLEFALDRYDTILTSAETTDLVGPNWMIDSGIGDLEQLQTALGGELVTSGNLD